MSKHTTHWSLRSFVAYLSQYRRRMLAAGLVFAIADMLLAVIPLLVGTLVDTLTRHQDPWLFVWLLVASSVLHDITWQWANIAYRKYLLPVTFTYETLLFRHVIKRPYHYFTDKFTGKLSSYVTQIAQELRDMFSEVFFSFISQFIAIIAVVLILGSINWQTAVIFVVFLVCMLLVGRLTLRRATASERHETDVTSTKNGYIVDAISNFASVKAFHKERSEVKAIRRHQMDSLQAASSAFNWGQVFWWSQSVFVRWLIWPSIIILNVVFYLQGSISIGQLATILSTAIIFTSTIWEIIWNFSQINLKLARVEEAHTYLFGERIIRRPDAETPLSKVTPIKRSLVFQNLSFAYPDKPTVPVLDAINLTVRRGEKIGVVGKSGSGKSTLTKVLVGYYDHTDGDILIDDTPANMSDFAELIAYVPQDTSLFHRSIADNIAYAATNTVSRSDIEQAAKQAQAHEFIIKLAGGYDAHVGERGVKLSGGQRQRIAIARAILADAPVLILDEATSALDSESEGLVQRALENLWHNKTAIVIAHRLSTIAKLDRIIVLDQGKVVEEGSHSELLQHGGKYAKLWAHQSGGFIEE